MPRRGWRRWWVAAEIGLIFLVFFIQGAWPAPEANEPHYLSKAKHYWDASWCAKDFFCGTADAHQVFYFTFGWLSLWMPLPALAWCGRLLTWGLLACAWQRLSRALVPRPLYAVLSAALFVALNEHCQMSGEWVIGGVEAKGFAYALVLFGLAALVKNHWGRACLLFGAASSFHVIVGGWSVVAASIAWLASSDRPPLKQIILPLSGGLLLALPGLLGALTLTWNADPRMLSEANRIYVLERLSHHLVPQHFQAQSIVRHLALVAALVILAWFAPADVRQRRLRGFVAGAVGLAAIGMAIGVLIPPESDLSNALLRYYWFRLSDVMVPLGVALFFCSILLRWQTARPTWHMAALVAAMLLASGHMSETIWQRQLQLRPRSEEGILRLAAWRDICDWAAVETPTDAVFLVPRLAQTFRWYAGRAEVVTYKDIPQDAAGVVEWWRRIERIYPLASDGGSRHKSLVEQGSQRLRELGAEFGADYVVTAADPPLTLERVGPINSSFAIYRLPDRSTQGEGGPPRTSE
ncbi:MAG: hypothetical protein HY288_19840 [Planctomycetia bacterium]|nr:hypothetical protein [Planctomycetia bacterium]